MQKRVIDATRFPMDDVRQWLDSCDLGAMGHRTTLVEAMRLLDAGAGRESLPTAAAPTVDSTATVAAERRRITVMFCELVGSIALGERMDMVGYRDLLARFRNAMVEALERSEGHSKASVSYCSCMQIRPAKALAATVNGDAR